MTTPVRLVVVGENAHSEALLNRTTEDMLTGSGYLVTGADFAGFARADGVGVSIMDARYGAIGNGVANDSAAIALAEAAAYAAGATLIFPAGKTFYTGSTTTTIRCNLSALGATISYNGTGVALQIGQSSVATQWGWYALPQVIQAGKTASGWAQMGGADVGVRLLNLYSSTVIIPRVNNFSVGLDTRGEGRGIVYNNILIGHLDNNKVNHKLSADATGWTNENSYYGGRWSKNSSEGTAVVGTRGVLVEACTNVANNNRWFGAALEGDVDEFEVECFGSGNFWTQCRWECTGGAAVQFNGLPATSNIVAQGYKADQIVFTQVNSAFKNVLVTPAKTRSAGSVGADGMLVLSSTSSSSDPLLVMLPSSVDPLTATPSTAYEMALGPQLLRGKRTGDSFPRVQANFQTAALLMGNGTATPTAGMSAFSSDQVKITGMNLPVTAITFASSPYTALSSDTTIMVDTSGGAVTINLPSATNVLGHLYYIKKSTADANTVTIDASGTQTIDGALTLVLAGGSLTKGTIQAVTSTTWAILG